ncbi:MAG: B12-binding domain-containing radical SAM protein [Kangiellaceae bacterium]|nr:B12-binding domain-containing radical SAM protein [Kangiellaceae bacterium]
MIILTTLNAKYIHASLGLRYLYANLEELQSDAKICEYTINSRPIDIAEKLLEQQPTIIGFGVYIWNCQETLSVISQIKAISPETKIILGGPEISYETEQQKLAEIADFVITGAADKSFYQLCKDILAGQLPENKILRSKPVELAELKLPYDLYSDEDLKQRVMYIEASRGCPFKCEFCLSALDKNAYPFELERFLTAMDKLFQRGARHFKFVDRTFNLKITTTLEIIDFFLDRMCEGLFLHFEVIPDHLPEKLKDKLRLFPEGSLQFEVGIQTFNKEVQAHISRRQKNQKSKDNLVWLRDNTNAHIHADLIFGLPGESLESFAQSFDELYVCRPHEIQMGILKRLRGSPLIRHTEKFDLRFSPEPPYNILSNNTVDFFTMQRVNRFARYWDMIGNSGRFSFSLPLLLADSPFDNFLKLTDWLFEQTGQTHKINLKRLYELIAQACEKLIPENHQNLVIQMEKDYDRSKLKGAYQLLAVSTKQKQQPPNRAMHSARQQRHVKSLTNN